VRIDLETQGDLHSVEWPLAQQSSVERSGSDRGIQKAYRCGSKQLVRMLQHLARECARRGKLSKTVTLLRRSRPVPRLLPRKSSPFDLRYRRRASSPTLHRS